MAANPWKGIPYAVPQDPNKWKGIPYSVPTPTQADVSASAAPKLDLNALSEDAINQQKAGISDIEQLALGRLQSAKVQPDISPILSLIDTHTGSNLAKSYVRPESPTAGLEKFYDTLQGRKSDLAKTVENAALREAATQTKRDIASDSLDARQNIADQSNETKLLKLKSMGLIMNPDGSISQDPLGLLASQINRNKASAANMYASAANGGTAGVRRDALALRTGEQFDKDTILKQIQTSNNSLDRAIGMMDGKAPVTGKNFALLQQDMINAMAPGGAATEGKVNREMVNTLAAELNDIQTRFGSINDLRKEQPQLFAQLRQQIAQVKHDFNSAGKQRVGEIAENSSAINNQQIKSTVENKVKLLNQKFNAPTESGGGAKPKTVMQNGHKYTLNEATGKYE